MELLDSSFQLDVIILINGKAISSLFNSHGFAFVFVFFLHSILNSVLLTKDGPMWNCRGTSVY